MVPSDKILPPPAILEKLTKLDPQAAAHVVKRARIIGEERREAERLERATPRTASTIKSFLGGLASVFGVAVEKTPRRIVLDSAESINRSWVQTGNDIRAALREYCNINPKIAEKAQLTRDEWLAMKDVNLSEFPPRPSRDRPTVSVFG